MARLDDDRHAFHFEFLNQEIRNLFGQTLLHLGAAGEEAHHPVLELRRRTDTLLTSTFALWPSGSFTAQSTLSRCITPLVDHSDAPAQRRRLRDVPSQPQAPLAGSAEERIAKG